MRIFATIFQTYESEWKVKISPRRNRDGTYAKSTVSFWSPPGEPDDGMLIYDPIITIGVRNRRQKEDSVYIPIHLVYALEDSLSVAYNNLNTKGLYTSDGKHLFIDAKLADQKATKVVSYRDTLVFYPVLMYLQTGEELKGIRIVANGKTITDMRHHEIRELCETLAHLDIQTFSLVAGLLEKLDVIDTKLDRVLAGQSVILQAIKDQGNKIPEQKQPNRVSDPADAFIKMLNNPDFKWSKVEEGR